MFKAFTSTCNLGCAFCDHDVVPEADPRSADVVVIGGGEPSLHEDLPGAIRDLRASGAREVEVRTNGLRMA
ncbi:MAG: anaerobic ribonucleoside-triphosphate reductase activating protein, partial [Deltaproteobacteria bacterium]|nr:anaerobic ribonucleoside-triphosphate reductase activating protein [Deltaproteobacteria bacterium]